MFISYDVEIIEKRTNGKLVLCTSKSFRSKKEAFKFASRVMENIKAYPYSVSIYKNVKFMPPTKVFFMSDGFPCFHEVDLYLNN